MARAFAPLARASAATAPRDILVENMFVQDWCFRSFNATEWTWARARASGSVDRRSGSFRGELSGRGSNENDEL